MKNIVLGALSAVLVILGIAAMRSQPNGILITGGFGEEPKLKAVQADQTANWIEFNNFAVPASGILPVQYGGTGKATAGLTTNLAILVPGPSTNTLYITNGILFRIN